MRKKYMVELNKCREIVANAIHARVSDCVFVMNATTGVNEILQSLPWKAGDSILYYSTVYGSNCSVVKLNQVLVRKLSSIYATRFRNSDQ